jgi:molybdopterin-containing oxidoreductase family membrane subunit
MGSGPTSQGEENANLKALSVHPYIRPIIEKRIGINLLSVLLACGTAYWLYYCIRILSEGLTTLGIDTYGATWGILVANAVHIIGISHVGIAISAAVRILRLEQYRNIARTSEFVTLIALIMALINICLHVGRPDRFIINVILYGKWHSPLVWSMTVFILYFLASSIYLYLSMRRDLWRMTTIAHRFKSLYRFLILGYKDSTEQRDRHERTLFWLAICLIPIMISVHSIYGLLFGMISAKAGWYNPLQAPYFVLGAIVSGFSAIIIIAALLRRAYSWQNLLTDRLFRVFGIFLAFVVFLYLYFILSEQLTAQYLPLAAEKAVSDSTLTGRFSALFWLTTAVGLIIPFIYLLVQGLKKNYVHVGLTATASLLVNVALWLKRYLVVVPSQFYPHISLARPQVEYVPTYTEWVVTLGSYAVAALAFVLLLKFLPMFELPVATGMVAGRGTSNGSATRRLAMLISLLAGLLMIIWGLATRDYDFAPVKWLIGIIFLLAIPFENCLIEDSAAAEARETNA